MIPAVQDDLKSGGDLLVGNRRDAVLLVAGHIDLEVRDAILFQECDIRLGIFAANQRPIDDSSEEARQRVPEKTYRTVFSPNFFRYGRFSGLGKLLR